MIKFFHSRKTFIACLLIVSTTLPSEQFTNLKDEVDALSNNRTATATYSALDQFIKVHQPKAIYKFEFSTLPSCPSMNLSFFNNEQNKTVLIAGYICCKNKTSESQANCDLQALAITMKKAASNGHLLSQAALELAVAAINNENITINGQSVRCFSRVISSSQICYFSEAVSPEEIA